MTATKPLNILVYCCKSPAKFDSVSRSLLGSIGQSKYTIYQLDESEPWQQHCSLVVLATHPYDIPFGAMTKFRQFNRGGGKILSIGGYFSLLLPLDSFREPPGPCLDEICIGPSNLCVGQGKDKSLILVPVKAINDKSIMSQALKELGILCQQENKVDLQPLHVFSRNSTILEKFFDNLKQKITFDKDGDLMITMSSNKEVCSVPIIKSNCSETEFFDEMDDCEFPEIFISSKTVTSTQDLLWDNSILSSGANSVAILADVQLNGRGRGKNQWISPPGSMCFSFYFTIPQKCLLTNKLTFVQYIAALASIDAVNAIVETHLPIKIKWPNDIYTSEGAKIGGVLVNCSSNGSITSLCVGIGLNVNNSDPTISISKLSEKNIPITRLAKKICTTFVDEVNKFNELGHNQFVARFCQNWLHQEKQVKISIGKISCTAVIKSIDNNGFLSVQNLSNGEIVSVQPDGNSFDMMTNLIAVKAS